ncbi:uncharacterized protein Z520_09702 [Fonsecaea multimorphosa CBS 102226]|uniref:Mob1/phocein n=1 Tax=Fonsecaea multimorphosa CBS 102226 TaxID=1442371 RepID=A0A0D2IBY2_9EURO|nr:uncharacterized protein Z520_09702 [Fonsecaea multimorphosa CBS 102226]KIX94656.1 hypothetical protein Z520_09702 [Fonsecaea multimorphosa CBS 102226]OAL20228.1 hypothetical protein AYO22_09075 [Fonsecaea multimorphosa]
MTAVTPSRSGVSPSSSPRLPSPPPIPEVQFGPKSPGVDLSKELSLDATSKPDEGAARRIRPGTKAADMALGPPLIPLSQLDSPFQLQEHLKSLYAHLTHTQESTHTVPITKESALQLATPPQINDHEFVDRNLWLYELCRFLTQKANIVSIFLMNDNPPCSAQTCPEMRASEWQYLCAVHEPPKSCCAIDYCNHTLDWAANVLTSPKHFPSRLALGSEAGNVIQSMRQLTNIFRRVYRIFAHAWFQHRDVFWSVEATYGLYLLFKVVCDEYHLIPEDSYTIPAEAEGVHEAAIDREGALRPQILHRDNAGSSTLDEPSTGSTLSDIPVAMAPTTVSTGATTRRHKHTPSTGSHVATIAEGQEEEEEHPKSSTAAPKNPPPPPQLVEMPNTIPASERDDSSLKSDGTGKDRNKGKSPERLLPKLDITSTVPKYEPRASEDPTPTGTSEDIDPLSTHMESQNLGASSTTAGGDVGLSTIDSTANSNEKDEPVKVETPIEQTIDPFQEEEGQKITSPSGGSIRTSGSDVLGAILGHIHDLDDGNSIDAEKQSQAGGSGATLPAREAADRMGAAASDDKSVEDNEGMSPIRTEPPLSTGPEDGPSTDDQGEDEAKTKNEELGPPVDEVRISVEEATDDLEDDAQQKDNHDEQGDTANTTKAE